MDEKTILKNINLDLGRGSANRVIYMEGKSDPPLFFALLGVTLPATTFVVHKGTVVVGLGDNGSGKRAVETYLTVAAKNRLGQNVFGIVDGDGEPLADLVLKFDHPFAGPLYTWKAYNIESLFPQCPWNGAWGAAPDWQVELVSYAAYVGLNRTHQRLEKAQADLGLSKRTIPKHPDALRTVAGEKARLAAAKGKLTGFDAEAVFDAEVSGFLAALGNGIVEAMALLDGKWLLADYLVRNRGGGNDAYWRREWAAHVTASGGITEVKDLWQRITGSPP
jgi:hypothetical protein